MSHPGDLLSAYLDDELPDEERQAVALHLESCPDCRDELTSIQTAAVALRSLPVVESPPGLVPTRAPWHRRRRWQALGATAAGALAAGALVVGVAVMGDGGPVQLAASDTVPVALEGLDRVPAGDPSVDGQERVQAIEAAFRTMPDVDEMDMSADDMTADVEVMMDDEPMKVKAGMWDGVAAPYLAVMTPADGVVGLWLADEEGMIMAFFYCEHSWYRVESKSGRTPDMKSVTSLRSALGCDG